MPAFTTMTIKKPKKGTGASTAYSLYQRELDLLKAKYENPFTKKISSKEYFVEKKAVMERALKNPAITNIKKTNILTDRDVLEKDSSAWEFTNQKVFKLTTDQIKETLDDNWQSVWKNADILRSGNVPAMALGMLEGEGGINDIIGQLEEVESVMNEIPGSEDAIIPIRKNIEYLEDRADFWRGAASRPKEYAVTVDSEADGSIKNFQIKNIANTSGYRNTGADMGGFALYGKPHPSLADESGLETMVIGNNIFKGDKDGFMLEDKDGFDLSTLRNVPFGNYSPGTVLQSPANSYRVMDEDGGFTEYKNQQELERAGYSPEGIIKMDSDEYNDIDSMYDIRSGKEAMRERSTQERLEQIRSQYEDRRKSESWQSVGAALGQSPETVEMFKKGAASAAGGLASGFKGFVQRGKEALGDIFSGSKSKAVKAKGAREQEEARIMTGQFKSNKDIIK